MRVSFPCILFCMRAWIASSRSWSVSEDSLPVIQVKLAPPQQQLPDIQAETNQLQSLREELETEYAEKLQAAYGKAVEQARVEINKMIDGSLGLFVNPSPKGSARFLEIKRHQQSPASAGFGVKVNVAQAAAPSAATKGMIEKIEDKKAAGEKHMFEQACAEMQGLTEVVLHELGAVLHTHAAALQRADHVSWIQTQESATLPAVANVKIAASSVPFARVSDLVEAMEAKRDAAESLEKKSIVELELKLLEAENSLIKEALGSAALKIMASYAAA